MSYDCQGNGMRMQLVIEADMKADVAHLFVRHQKPGQGESSHPRFLY
jgi:hypothetical protein